MKIAVVNMPAILADNHANMKTAEEYIANASYNGANIICFPEFFNTGFALNPVLIKAIRAKEDIEHDLMELSDKYQIVIGGSYLNYDYTKANIYNTYGLFFPDGNCYMHSKDIPTALENFCYTSGDNISAFNTSLGRIGIVMCWEQLRYASVKRMMGKVDLLLAGSCWWCFTPEDGTSTYEQLAEYNKQLAADAPSRFAHIMGVPIIHSSHTGSFTGASMSDPTIICDRPIESRTMVCDAYGSKILEADKGPGCYICEVNPGTIKEGESMEIPDEYWIPKLPPQLEQGFHMMNTAYHKIYVNKTLPDYIYLTK